MEYFLESIARSVSTEFGNTLNRHCFVFPNRRAGLFFNRYLAATLGKPVWMPSVVTISEFFRSHSSLQTAGNEMLLFDLYKVYRKLKKSAETFDDFYFWGDILLNDFDDIDKYLVNASDLFGNVLDIKNIDRQFGGLTEDQIEIIKRFWLNFEPEKPTREKSEFLGIWSVLDGIYTDFRKSLEDKKLAYEGMIFRELAEDVRMNFSIDERWDMIHFIGFNALNECEKRVMLRLKKTRKARFYWDYDESYITDSGSNSAGRFMRENLRLFGNDMPEGWSYHTLLSVNSPLVRRRIIDTSSDVAQVKLVSELIREFPDLNAANAHQTAVILADENLLIPMLTSLPETIGDINITMGYPLKQTLVYTLIRHLMDLQNKASVIDGIVRFNYRDVTDIIKNALVSVLLTESDIEILEDIKISNLVSIPASRFSNSEYLSSVFIKPDPLSLSGYFRNILMLIAASGTRIDNSIGYGIIQKNILKEFVYQAVLTINRLESVLASADVSFSSDTYIRILDRMLRIQSVPFAGEPLSGIQIMGILETRALDFRNLIILSVNEGVLPSLSSSSSSFIPFSLREAFGLPSVNHQESIYAYHFYRLLQRAENVIFTYNSSSDGLKSGEMSRFLIQMNLDPVLKPDFTNLNFEIKSHSGINESIERSDEHTRRLYSRFLEKGKESILSPSAINMWIGCRMKFFYRYVNNLKEHEEVTAEIDPAMLGKILHDAMKCLYSGFAGKDLHPDAVESLLVNRNHLDEIIEQSICNTFSNHDNSFIDGNQVIVKDVLVRYLTRILRTDKELSPIRIISLENAYRFNLSVQSDAADISVLIGGVVDRIDKIAGITRIVDYKTGSVADSIKSISDLFEDDRKKDIDGWLQTLVYCEAFLLQQPGIKLRPSIYKIRKIRGESHSDRLKLKADSKNEILLEDYNEVREEFVGGLKETVSRIFSYEEPFYMTEERAGKCKYCVYKMLCMR